MKRLVILAPSYFPSTGGVEKHIRQVTRVLSRRGYKIDILVRYAGGAPECQLVDGVRVWRLPKWENRLTLPLWVLLHLPIFWRASTFHSHDYFPWPIYRLFGNRRWVHTFHGYEGYPVLPEAIQGRQAIRRVVPYCIGVGVFIEKWYGTPLDYVTYGAVDPLDISPPTDPQWDIVFVGRLEPDTGFLKYLEAFVKISEEYPGTSLLILGDGSQRSAAETLVRKHNLNVSFKGFVYNVGDYWNKSRVAFVSGYLTLLEAALREKPIVALYETPLKRDYLQCHPMAKNFSIVSTAKGVAQAFAKARRGPTGKEEQFKKWAQDQTWSKIVDAYEIGYGIKTD